MSFFAKGSFWKGFIHVHGQLVVYYNFIWPLIHKRNVIAHKIWMMRSYSMVMTAVTFRVYHIMFYLLGWGHLEIMKYPFGSASLAICFLQNG